MKWGIALSSSLPEKIRIFDTTLRSGEQTPRVSLTPEKKLRVGAIEVGFAAASDGEMMASIEAMLSGMNVLMTNHNELQLMEVS